MKEQDFTAHIQNGYATKGDSIFLGAAMLDGKSISEAHVKIPLKTLNRHGLIAGATGTGKTKTLQILAENLSKKGIPVLLMDIKGDLSGMARPAEPFHNRERYCSRPGCKRYYTLRDRGVEAMPRQWYYHRLHCVQPRQPGFS